ncbi:MAG: ATP-binding protein [Phycisphaerales bacterium]
MTGTFRQFGLIVGGIAALALVAVWSILARPPVVLTLIALPAGVFGIAWGLWGPARRESARDARAVLDEAALLCESLGSPVGEVTDDALGLRRVGESLARAREGAPDLLAADAERRDLRDVLEAVGEPVIATDQEGDVLLVNRAAERLLGIRGGAGEKRIDDVIVQSDVLALHEAAAQGRVASTRVRIAVGDGVRVFDTTATPIAVYAGDARTGREDRSGDSAADGARRWGVVLAFRDVTDLMAAVQARTDFVGNASHELRTPLTALRSAFDTLRAAIDDPKMRDRAFQLAGNNMTRLEEMTRDLLDLSRLESPDTQVRISRVDVADLAEDLAGQFETVCKARALTLSLEIDDAAREVDTDPRLVQEILRNLIDNACRFANEGTIVRVIGQATPDAAHGPERATLVLRVIDKGVGIPLEQQARIFERFYQVDPARSGKRRGTGLGLAIVKHAVRALGGSVKVESVWGQGTTMVVELPSAVAVGAGAR